MYPNKISRNGYFKSTYKITNNVEKRANPANEFPKSYPHYTDKPDPISHRVGSSHFRGTLSNLNNRMNSSYRKINNLSKPKFSTKYYKSQPILPKPNQLKWDNRSKVEKPNLLIQSSDSTRVANVFRGKLLSSNTPVIPHPASPKSCETIVPFFSALARGWLSNPPCNVCCAKRSSLNLQTCCFISEKYVPANTLNLGLLTNPTSHSSTYTTVKAQQDLKNDNSFVKLSEHKLIRKPERIDRKTLKTNADPSLVWCTKRKLIRECNSSPKLTSVSSEKELLVPISQKENAEIKSTSTARRSLFGTKKRRNSLPTVVLTDRKLIRKLAVNENAPDASAKPKAKMQSTLLQNWRKPSTSKLPSRLIRVNRNKLIRSTLLRKIRKHSIVNSPSKSVLSRIIQYRRLPCSGSSYVLLTRNKLIKKPKFKNRTWRKYAETTKSGDESKKSRLLRKAFVALGSNKLIRKSLFTKTNKDGTQKNVAITSPMKNKFLIRMLNSRRRRIQTFTNHWSRVNLKYVTNASSRLRNKFTNKCKNNRRILRRKKNVVCPVFRRSGKCSKYTLRKCSFLHDKKYVAVCQSHIQSSCTDENCLLSHDLIAEKMPVCLHFLNGNCQNENCMYAHRKSEVTAPICAQFLRGYCELAAECTDWHVFACPEFKNSGKCEKGKKCGLPHRDSSFFEGKESSDEEQEGNVINWRYFEKNKLDEKVESGEQIIPQRQSLGVLPDFIPL